MRKQWIPGHSFGGVWPGYEARGTMAQSGVGSLTVVEGREAYIKIVRKFVKKDARKLIGRRFTFQQDGAPCHTAKLTTAALQKANICVLPWVAQSPDLNPIEHRGITLPTNLMK